MEKIIEGTNGKYVITTEGQIFNLKYHGKNERREVATFLISTGRIIRRIIQNQNIDRV